MKSPALRSTRDRLLGSIRTIESARRAGEPNYITDGIYQASFATLPGVELKRIDDAAHFVMFDQPDAFFAELDSFLAE